MAARPSDSLSTTCDDTGHQRHVGQRHAPAMMQTRVMSTVPGSAGLFYSGQSEFDPASTSPRSVLSSFNLSTRTSRCSNPRRLPACSWVQAVEGSSTSAARPLDGRPHQPWRSAHPRPRRMSPSARQPSSAASGNVNHQSALSHRARTTTPSPPRRGRTIPPGPIARRPGQHGVGGVEIDTGLSRPSAHVHVEIRVVLFRDEARRGTGHPTMAGAGQPPAVSSGRRQPRPRRRGRYCVTSGARPGRRLLPRRRRRLPLAPPSPRRIDVGHRPGEPPRERLFARRSIRAAARGSPPTTDAIGR